MAHCQQTYGLDTKRSPRHRSGVGLGIFGSGKVPDGSELLVWGMMLTGFSILSDFMLPEEHRGACNGQSRFLDNCVVLIYNAIYYLPGDGHCMCLVPCALHQQPYL